MFAQILAVITCLSFFTLVTGTTVSINGIAYYPSSELVATISISSSQRAVFLNADLVPLTVVDGGKGSFGSSELQTVVKTYTTSDDVFNTGFLQGEILFINKMYSLTVGQQFTSDQAAT